MATKDNDTVNPVFHQPTEEEMIQWNITFAKKNDINLSVIPENHIPETPSTWDLLTFRLHRAWQNNVLHTLAEDAEIALSDNPSLTRSGIQLREQRNLAEAHPNAYMLQQIKDARGADDVGGLAGDVAAFTGYTLDPLMALPVGRSLKAVFGIGAATGTVANTAYQYNEGPEINLMEGAIVGALSGVLATGLVGGGRYAANKYREFRGGSPAEGGTVVPEGGRTVEGSIIPEGDTPSSTPPMTSQSYRGVMGNLRDRNQAIRGLSPQPQAPQPYTPNFTLPTQNLPMARPTTAMTPHVIPLGDKSVDFTLGVNNPLTIPRASGMMAPRPPEALPLEGELVRGGMVPGTPGRINPKAALEQLPLEGEVLTKSVVRALAETPEVTPGVLDTLLKTNGIKLPSEALTKLATQIQGSKEGIVAASQVSRPNFQNIGINTVMGDNPKWLALTDRIAQGKTWNLLDDQWRDLTVYSKERVAQMSRGIDQIKSEQVARKRLATVIESQANIEKRLDRELKSIEEEIYNINPERISPEKYNLHMSHALNKVESAYEDVTGKKAKDRIEDLSQSISNVYWKMIGEDKPKYLSINEVRQQLKVSGVKATDKEVEVAVNRMHSDRNISKMDLKKGPSIYMEKPLLDKYLDEAATSWHKRRLERAAAIAKETGGADPRFINLLARTGGGGAIGFAVTGEEEGALAGAALGAGITPLVRAIMNAEVPYNFSNTIGKLSDWARSINTPDDFAKQVNKYVRDTNAISRVSVKMKNLGASGRYFNTLLDHAYDNVQLSIADTLMKYNKAIKGIDKRELRELELKAADYLEGRLGVAQLSEEGKRVANALKAIFEQNKKDAFSTGIWKGKQGKKMEVENYFPRVMDVGKLQSKEGREQFIETLLSMNWSTKSLTDTYKALTGTKEGAAKAFVDSLRNSNGDLVLSRNLAKKFYQRTLDFENTKGGSTHLDHQRTLNIGKYDTLMHPFRIREASKFMDRYLHDTRNRIEHAKVFGANHERATVLQARIADEVAEVSPNRSRMASEYALKTYFNQAAMRYDGNVIDAHMKQSSLLKTTNGKMTAFEVFNLLFSQVLQPSAAFVNGTTLMSKTMPLHQAFNTNVKALMKTFSKDPMWEDFTSRAASGLNVGFIDNISEATMEATLFGRSAFNDQYLKWINTPQGWLKFIGVMKLERFNQRWATIQGKAMVEHLMDNRRKIATGEINDPRVIEETKALYDELDLGWDKSPEIGAGDNAITVADVHRAAMRFNRAVSFTDGARELPHLMRSPMMTLARLFSTYMYRQSAFINDHIVKGGILKGNLRPLAAYIAAGTVMGWPVRELLEFVKSDDREYTATVELIKNLETAGGFGRLMALIGAGTQGGREFFTTAAGPAWNDLLRLTEGGFQSVGQLDIKPLAEAAVDVLPTLPFGAKRAAAESLGIKEQRRLRQTEQDIYEYLRIDQKRKREGSSGGGVGLDAGLGMSLSAGIDF